MRNPLRSRSVVALLAATTLSLAVPGAAGAADHSGVSPSYTAGCATAQVYSLYHGLAVRESPHNTAKIMETVDKDELAHCWLGWVTLGDRYNGCGVSNANGWIHIVTRQGQWGYSAMTCWEDFNG